MRWLLSVVLALGLTSDALAGKWADIDEPLRTEATAPADAAVVVGLENYPFLTDVPYAARDAEAFKRWLVYTRGVPVRHVHHLEGASAQRILQAVEEAASEVGMGGTLWFYFAGHGAAHPETGERLLVGDTAKTSEVDFLAGSLQVADIHHAAQSSGVQVVLVLDACYNGFGRDGSQLVDSRFAVPLYIPKPLDFGSVEWTAAGPSELAGVLNQTKHGAFTYFVVGALRGWADGELGDTPDGIVTLEEAAAYVDRALDEAGYRNQNPAISGDMNSALAISSELMTDKVQQKPDFSQTATVTSNESIESTPKSHTNRTTIWGGFHKINSWNYEYPTYGYNPTGTVGINYERKNETHWTYGGGIKYITYNSDVDVKLENETTLLGARRHCALRSNSTSNHRNGEAPLPGTDDRILYWQR